MFKKIFLVLFILVVIIGFYHTTKPVPTGLDMRSELYSINDEQIRFIADRTYRDQDDNIIYKHEIFDTILDLIEKSNRSFVMDMFLFNKDTGQLDTIKRDIVEEITQALISQKNNNTDSIYTIITDPINTGYDSYTPYHIKRLAEHGIRVIFTNLERLPDSNPIYSAWYRSGLQFLPPVGGGVLPNIFEPDGEGMNLRGFARLLNFKANHRKVIVSDGNQGTYALISSMNIHNASSQHSNSGVLIKNHPIINDIIQSEQSVINFTNKNNPIELKAIDINDTPKHTENLYVQLLTEYAIKNAVLERINTLESGDKIDIAMFYISDRNIVKSLKKADSRGVNIRLLFDPNRDAFGREKNGIPNRQVAHELAKNTKGNTIIRWCDTSGEQCHSKFMLTQTTNDIELIIGSANFTRRNIANLNLETNVRIVGNDSHSIINDAIYFFEEQWTNKYNRTYSTHYDTYSDSSRLRTIWYHIGEFSGLSHY